jgi:transcriptional regulator with XRE-family HTH domain
MRAKRPAGSTAEEKGSTELDHLERAIGHQVRSIRKQMNLTVLDIARLSGLSPGMLSKVETGAISPSLATLRLVAKALNVPITTFFQEYEEQREAAYFPPGKAPIVDRRGSRLGFRYHLLGHPIKRSKTAVEPYVIELDKRSDTSGLFQHEGVQFIFVLEGEVVYRHGSKSYTLKPGASLFFDAEVPHGPSRIVTATVRLLSMTVRPRFET